MLTMLALVMRLYTFVPVDPVLADLGVYPMTAEDFEDETSPASSPEDDSDGGDDESDCEEW